jgi:hypothetical protein
VQAILNVHKDAKHLLTTVLGDHPSFHFKLEEAFSESLNRTVGMWKMPELFAHFCDQILSGKVKMLESTIEVRAGFWSLILNLKISHQALF